MIRHIVLFSARDPADVPAIRSGLEGLGVIPGVRHLEVALNSKRDPLANDIDVVLYAEFDDRAALDAYQSHPAYQDAVRIVRPLREQRIAVDFEAAADG